MDTASYLQELRDLLLANKEVVGDLEYTNGNHDDKSSLISNQIPTITTQTSEIGIYDDVIYFTFIILVGDFKKELFDCLTRYNNVQIYPFKDFNNTLYPKLDFDYSEFEQQIKQDKYLQINFNDSYKKYTPAEIMKKYLEYKEIFLKSGIEPVNQLKPDKIDL